MIPGTGPVNIDTRCNCWDYIRWIFVLWTFFVPFTLILSCAFYGTSIYLVPITFILGILFLIVAHCILAQTGQYKSTYEMVEEEIEFGNNEHEQAQSHLFGVCDGCEVYLSGADDTFEKDCIRGHIICSKCYNLWLQGFSQLNFSVTQDWRRQIEHIFCPVCDKVIVDGQIDLNQLAQQIQILQQQPIHNNNNNNHHNNHNSNNNDDDNKYNENDTSLSEQQEEDEEEEEEEQQEGMERIKTNESTQMIVRTVDLSGSSSGNININIQNEMPITTQGGNNDNNNNDTINNENINTANNTNSDTSHSNFEMITTTDFLSPN